MYSLSQVSFGSTGRTVGKRKHGFTTLGGPCAGSANGTGDERNQTWEADRLVARLDKRRVVCMCKVRGCRGCEDNPNVEAKQAERWLLTQGAGQQGQLYCIMQLGGVFLVLRLGFLGREPGFGLARTQLQIWILEFSKLRWQIKQWDGAIDLLRCIGYSPSSSEQSLKHLSCEWKGYLTLPHTTRACIGRYKRLSPKSGGI